MRRLHFAVFAFGFLACGAASVLLGQDDNWDLRNYHYYNPYAFVADRLGFDIAPAQRQSYLNPLADLPFYAGMNHLPPKLLGFVMGGVHGLAFGFVFAICFVVLRALAPRPRFGVSALCAGLGIYAPVFACELGASQNDTLVGLFVLASTAVLVRTLAAGKSLGEPAARRALVAAALLLGVGTGLKLTLMLHVLAFAAAVIAVETGWRNRGRILAIGGAGFLVGWLASSGWWMAKLWRTFGNPFFPFYNQVFQSPWAETRSFADRSLVPTSVWEALGRPIAFAFDTAYTRLEEFRDARYAVLYALLVVLALVWLYRLPGKRPRSERPVSRLPSDARFLIVFFVVSFVVWEANFSIIRYASALEALAPLLIVIVACDLVRRNAARTIIVAAGFACIAVVMRPVAAPRVPWGASFWEVQVPAIDRPADAMVIMANSRPWAYLIPMFPAEVRWVALNNNLTTPTRPTRMQAEIRRLLRRHQGEIYLLSTSPGSSWLKYDRSVIVNFELDVVEGSARPIVSKHSIAGLQLWRLRRTR